MSVLAPEAVEAPPAGAPDPAAPYGRFKSGRPRKAPKGAAAQAKRSAGSSSRPAAGPRRSAPKAPDFRPGIMGLFQAATIPLSFAAPADAAAVSTYAPGVAEALNDLAKVRPEVAAMLSRVLEAGPYGALIAAVLPLGIQLATNHELIPEPIALRLGATPKRDILRGLAREADAMAAAAKDAETAEAADSARVVAETHLHSVGL